MVNDEEETESNASKGPPTSSGISMTKGRARKISRTETNEMLTLDAPISDGQSTDEETNESADETSVKRKRGRSKMATVRWEEDSLSKYENSDFLLEPMDEPTKVPIPKLEARRVNSNLATEEQMTAMFKDLRSQIEALTARQNEIKVAPAEIKVTPGPSQLHYKKPMLPKFDGSQDLNIWLLNLERLFTSHTSDEEKVEALTWHLEGNAVLAISMLQSLGSEPTYDEAIKALREMIPHKRKSVRYNQEESLSMYSSRVYLDLLRESKHGSVCADTHIKSFISGLPRRIADYVERNKADNITEAIKYADQMTAFLAIVDEKPNRKESMCVIDSQEQAKRLKPFEGKCFRCDQFGHTARNCLAKPRKQKKQDPVDDCSDIDLVI